MSQTPMMKEAQTQWQQLLGVTRVLTTPESLAKYHLDTTEPQPREIPCVILAHNIEEIIQIVKIAGACHVSLYPISTGNNWGYGSANPVTSGCVILDLSGMNKISNYDAQLGIVTTEPGVTQGMLADFLKSQNDEFMAPVTGAGPQASILGNALERGYGLTPVADHFLSLMSLEAVLPDGSVYRSALHSKGCETIDQVFKWGIGPYLDGIFAQGNFGIVTKITIQLAHRPEAVGAFICEMRDEKDLEKAVLLVRETLREMGGMTGSINVMNSLRLLSMSAPYPFEAIAKDPENFITILKKMAADLDFAPWTCVGSFYGKKEVINVTKKLLRAKLYSHNKRLMFLSRKQILILEKILRFLPTSISQVPLMRIKKMQMTFDILEGRPSQIALPLCYRKLPQGAPKDASLLLNPAKDGCGIMWYAPLVPMKTDIVRQYVDFVHEVCKKHYIEPLITLTSLSDRCFDSTVPILFDAKNPKEVAQAKACLNELFNEGQKLGFYPYRASIDMMDQVVSADQTFWKLQKKLKDAVDPQGIVAPGRYSLS